MTRTELFALAADCGWERGKKMSKSVEAKVRKRLLEALTPESLSAAPRVQRGDGMRAMTKEDAITALMEEL